MGDSIVGPGPVDVDDVPVVEGDWRVWAACRGMDPELFFSERGDEGDAVLLPKSVCRGCPVTAACLAEGMHHQAGVWGGLSPRERRRLRRGQRPLHDGGGAHG